MRTFLLIIVVTYLGGIGFDLLPEIQRNWHKTTLIEQIDTTLRDLPRAATWPVRAFRSVINRS
jgi:hypothetical protein